MFAYWHFIYLTPLFLASISTVSALASIPQERRTPRDLIHPSTLPASVTWPGSSGSFGTTASCPMHRAWCISVPSLITPSTNPTNVKMLFSSIYYLATKNAPCLACQTDAWWGEDCPAQSLPMNMFTKVKNDWSYNRQNQKQQQPFWCTLTTWLSWSCVSLFLPCFPVPFLLFLEIFILSNGTLLLVNLFSLALSIPIYGLLKGQPGFGVYLHSFNEITFDGNCSCCELKLCGVPSSGLVSYLATLRRTPLYAKSFIYIRRP